MRAIITGATGMVGEGVLLECLNHPDVNQVLVINRRPGGVSHPKLAELIHEDFFNLAPIEERLAGFDACFFCLGVSSVGTPESEYERITYGITLAAAETLVRLNPAMTFVYVSGAGTDSSEHGCVAWARVKGRTENALLALPFKAAYMFRPGVIQPLDGIQAKTASVRIFYSLTKPLLPMLRRAFPAHILTTAQIGRAMLIVARTGAPKHVLETRDISALA